jgi:tRNA threonylcarbamoyl adenosine modification protein YeaZ/ribosomal-protein-alanine acetyltransferase
MPESMLLLAIDTCGPTGSVALGQLVRGELHVLGESILAERSYSVTLVASVCELLGLANMQLGLLHAMVAVNGPGSFTGVRVGLAAVKGLAESARIPVVAVSRLEVLAGKAEIASSALDAHRHELFLRLGGPDGQARELLAGAAELAGIKPPPARIAVCDDAAAAMLGLEWPATELVRTAAPTAADALRLCAARAAARYFVDLALLDGNYLRRSDAEIFGEADEAAEKPALAARKRVPPDAVILVRPMRGMDLNEVMALAASLKEAPQWTRANYIAALDSEAVPRCIALVTDGGQTGKVVGFSVASLMPPRAELEIIAVDAQFQRRGLARKLFEELAGKLGLAGVREVILEVRASNQPALGLYRQLGFVETGRRPRYYQAPADDAVLMRLVLEGFEP